MAVVALGWLLIADQPAQAQREPTLTTEEKVRRVLDAATALDEQAQRAKSVAQSRAKWLEAARLLDDFLADHEALPAASSLRFQAAVYLWARARALLDRVDLLAATDPERIEVAGGLDDVIGRLRRIIPPPPGAGDPLARNIRFRLAQALADRARLYTETDAARIQTEKEAQGLLDRSLTASRLQVFARLLHAELANRLGEFGPAQIEIEELAKLKEPSPVVPLTDARITALAGRGQFTEANQIADASAVAPDQKTLWKLRVALARRKQATVGRDREATEAAIFGAAQALKSGTSPEAARGLMELARGIDQPAAASPTEWWDLLADGQLLLRDPARAARLAARGVDQVAPGPGDRAASLRYKVGACWFQAANYPEAIAALSQVVDDATAPRSLRAKAGMLRVLSQGRALAEQRPGTSRADYLAALETQLRAFGDDPSSGEARWLLGKVRQLSGRREEAITLWAGITHGQPRWLEAQTTAADLAIGAIEDQWVNRDSQAIEPRVIAARKLIRAGLDQAIEGDEVVSLGSRLARLESIPGVGEPAEAVTLFDRLLRAPASADQHQQARLGRMVAFAEQNRFADAEIVARTEVRTATLDTILPAVRLLDQWATLTTGDLIRKRTGELMRILLGPWIDPPDRAPVSHRDEVILRYARALLLSGNTLAGKREIARWGGPTSQIDDPGLLRDLGDTYLRLEAYALAADAERLRAKSLAPATPGWFDARYQQALALYRSNQVKEARKIIDATSILHPDLGGGETRIKFERLSQKINTD